MFEKFNDELRDRLIRVLGTKPKIDRNSLIKTLNHKDAEEFVQLCMNEGILDYLSFHQYIVLDQQFLKLLRSHPEKKWDEIYKIWQDQEF